MKVLVLGASGQLGTDLCRAARHAARFEMVPLDRSQLDVARVDTIARALMPHDFQVLINCTGFNRVDDAEAEAGAAMRVNAQAVQCLAGVCRDKRARFVHISTDFVFDGETTRPYIESDLLAPINLYGASKALGELLAAQVWHETLVLRTASLFGVAGSRERGGNFVEAILRLAAQQRRVTVIRDVVMSPTGTADLAAMILRLLEREAPPGTYHAVNSGGASWYEFAEEIIRQSQVSAEVVPIPRDAYPQRARRPAFSVLANAKLAGYVGPIPHWRDALRDYLEARRHG